ncbi:MAG TPA: Gfo/Idh/MocA family oxidoreductase [Verrucomicrobiales bacterium]|nr:Gfo/Idh/MocA family oxidoreductase [Verrucomicrobiales bacterium]
MKEIGIGFAGAGWMGTVLLQRLLGQSGVRIRALHQRSAERAHATLLDLGLDPGIYQPRYEELLATPGVDAVVLCTPNSSHGPQSIAALEAGKHVFCEKPCATRYRDFLRQIELAESQPHLITFVDYLMNFDSLENRILDMVRDGLFGTISQIQVNYRHPINIAGEKRWKLDRHIIGDAIGMGIIHSLSVMLNIMAAHQARPVRVFAASSTIQSRGFEVPPLYSIQILFDSGATGFCFGNIDHANGYDAYHHIHGVGGGLVFDSYLDRPSKVRYWSKAHAEGRWIYPLDLDRCAREQTEAFAWPADTTTPDSGDVLEHQTGACIDHFLGCIRQNRQSHLSFPAAASTAETGWAALWSAATGAPVDLPLDRDKALAFFDQLDAVPG